MYVQYLPIITCVYALRVMHVFNYVKRGSGYTRYRFGKTTPNMEVFIRQAVTFTVLYLK